MVTLWQFKERPVCSGSAFYNVHWRPRRLVVPKEFRSDYGSKSGSMFLAEKVSRSLCWTESILFGSLHSNQRQEAWWSFLRVLSWIRIFLKKLIDDDLLYFDDKYQIACVKYRFGSLIYDELNEIKEVWNGNYFRKSIATPIGIMMSYIT